MDGGDTVENEKNLLSMETRSEYSLTTGRKETHIFLKMYVDAVHSGFLAEIGDENWRTLCVIAAFMDEHGNCYPTQDLIATRLGISRQSVNRRIKRLLEFRWNEKPVLHAIKKRKADGTWDRMRYTVMPISHLAIFGTMSNVSDTDKIESDKVYNNYN